MDKRRAVFFDRDGTLMEEVDYCNDPARVRVFPGVRQALHRLRQAGWLVIVATNQSGLARGRITPTQYQAVHAELLRQTGGEIDATYLCPDHPDCPSARRKPEPGMLLEAAGDFSIDLPASWMIGDKLLDVECGQRAGCRSLLVRTGYGHSIEPPMSVESFPDVVLAIQHILSTGST
jgi:D-glycero-D-manno-heptose 1,7-bisphosphate phosphatase